MPNNEEWTEERYTELLKTDKDIQRLHDRRIWKGVETALANAEEKSKATKEKADAEAKAKADAAADIDARETLLDRKLEAMRLAKDRDMDPEQVFSLLGLDDDSTDESRLDAVDAVRLQERRKIVKANGRTPHVTLDTSAGLYDRLANLAPEQLARVSDETILAADQENQAKGRKSLGQSLKDRFFGGKS